MTNTLTDLIPVMYKGLDTVARELVGFTRAVQLDASAEDVAVGQVINVPIVPKNTTSDITPAAIPSEPAGQDIGYVPMAITKSKKASIGWNGEQMKGYKTNGSYEKTLSDQFAQAVRAVIADVEGDLATEALRASRYVGTPNSTPFGTAGDMSDFANVRKVLEDNGSPLTDLHLVLNSAAIANIRGKMSNLFKVNEAGTDYILRTGGFFDIDGLTIHQSAFIKSPAVGTGSGYTTDSTGYAVGSTSITLTTGTGTILAGDVIQFADDPNYYTVKTGIAAPGAIEIEAPGLVQEIPASAKDVTVVAKSARNIGLHRSALILLARQPAMPDGGDLADDVIAITDPVSGITLQVAKYRQYRQVSYEVGLAWGVKTIKPEFIAGLFGAA